MSRLYAVIDKKTFIPRLVRANSSEQALIHIARTVYSVLVPSQRDLVDLLGQGVQVEHAIESDTQAEQT